MQDPMAQACRAIVQKILAGEVNDAQDLNLAKLWAAKEFYLSKVPSNAEILAWAMEEEKPKLFAILKRKPVRTASGVSIITVMTKPYPCPQFPPCIYCPGGPKFGTPQSYTGEEPAGLRAKEADYDPRRQVLSRLQQLEAIGHRVDKVEFIVLGGTQLAQPPEYLEWFITQCLNALSGAEAKTIEEAQAIAERARVRNSGITFETRPDWAREEHIDLLLRLGATRVELGVQTLYDDVYEAIQRGHTVEDVAEATRALKDAGFVVIYHMMPGLPGSDFERDLQMFQQLFEDPRFRPDGLKIYPCLVLRGTELHNRWLRGEFKAMESEEAARLIAHAKLLMPRWVRVHRIQRDIPARLIEAGVKHGNLAQLVEDELKRLGGRCRCIRCREVGLAALKSGVESRMRDIKLLVESYEASGGTEYFLSLEDTKLDLLVALLRLRLPSPRAHRPEIKGGHTAIVRELHVYGPLVPVGEGAQAGKWQHLGLGGKLLTEAERLARELDLHMIAVLSGIGVREYYRRFGYEREGPYMVKGLKGEELA
ncbi:MAG: tRNA uridine(34) 5-carboxymethylaminomethyl modification radical SAM/GNAT enzyme Elp3 [Hadesarchaea archaeon]|nr:tRNA uridine(34) 5-carboxymethylaminomethyl modification radical SAM/GNAT enzyme Elp3 [Hadesarchaea archaeon]